jgi:glycosyltransferase involved in cell wall biosynthesis
VKINIDYQIFLIQKYGGVSRYFTRLFENIQELGVDIEIISPIYQNQYLKEISDFNKRRGYWIEKIPPKTMTLLNFANNFIGGKISKNSKPDIIHESYYSLKPTFNVTTAKRIVTVYDMIHEKFSYCFNSNDKTTLLKKASIERADHVICISHSTKDDLCEIFDTDPSKISVVHLAFDTNSPQLLNELNLKPYLLYVGSRSGYKNFESLLRAVSGNEMLKDNFDIIAFGGGNFTSKEYSLIKSCNFNFDSVKQVSGDDILLNQLYRNASAFVYPSLYEGFGLPPLEAMFHNCPVVCSNTSSIPEVVGEAGQYFDPLDIESQSNAIMSVLFDNDLRNRLIIKGKERINSFSWGKCASETVAIYNKVLNV